MSPETLFLWPAAAMGAILGFVGAELICHVVFGVPW